MLNLFILNEIITNNLNYNLLNLISIVSILCGILVIISKNPIVSVLFLIGLFLSVAGYLMMLGINFIGLSYLLVYVGAVSILFLFILMLINVRISELASDNSNSIPLAVIISVFFSTNKLFSDVLITPNMSLSNESNYWESSNFSELFFVTSHSWDNRLAETFHITSIGNIIYTNYPLWLILTSIILLLAMIGSILITIKQ